MAIGRAGAQMSNSCNNKVWDPAGLWAFTLHEEWHLHLSLLPVHCTKILLVQGRAPFELKANGTGIAQCIDIRLTVIPFLNELLKLGMFMWLITKHDGRKGGSPVHNFILKSGFPTLKRPWCKADVL